MNIELQASINQVDKVETVLNKSSQKSQNEQKAFKILLVDDDKEDVMFFTELFEESFKKNTDFTIAVTDNYGDAIAKLRKVHFDLVIVDYRLGYHDGLELLNKVKEVNKDIPVVFVTGQGTQQTAVDALKGGADDYLVKDDLTVDIINKTFTRFLKLAKPSVTNSVKKFIDSRNSASPDKDSVDFAFFMNLDKTLSHIISFEPRKLFMKAQAAKAQGLNYTLFIHLDKHLKKD